MAHVASPGALQNCLYFSRFQRKIGPFSLATKMSGADCVSGAYSKDNLSSEEASLSASPKDSESLKIAGEIGDRSQQEQDCEKEDEPTEQIDCWGSIEVKEEAIEKWSADDKYQENRVTLNDFSDEGQKDDQSSEQSSPLALKDERSTEQKREWHRYASDTSSSPKTDDSDIFGTTDIDKIEPEKERKYLQNPFRELHYFYNYLQTTLEESCFDFANRTYGDDLKDHGWKTLQFINLHGSSGEYKKSQEMVYKQWHVRGQVELLHWDHLFKKLLLPVSLEVNDKIFHSADRLRQAAVHRYTNFVSIDDLECAMQLPALLQDWHRINEIQLVYDTIKADVGTMNAETRAKVDALLHINVYPVITQNDLLQRVQHLLEASCHSYAQRSNPNFWTLGVPKSLGAGYAEQGFEEPENVELSRWQEYFDETNTNQDPSSRDKYPFEDGDRYAFRLALRNARDFRNIATHRSLKTGDEAVPGILEERIEWAIRLAHMLGDSAQADAIQRIADEWFERNPRKKLEEMENNCTNLPDMNEPTPTGWPAGDDFTGAEGPAGDVATQIEDST